MRMAYGYQYLYGQEEKAIPYAQRWAELDPQDKDALAVIQECQKEIAKRAEAEAEDESDHTGVFTGFVLLSRAEWDKAQFIRDMKEKWDISVEEYDASEEKDDDALVFEVGDMLAAVSLAAYPIPGGERTECREQLYVGGRSQSSQGALRPFDGSGAGQGGKRAGEGQAVRQAGRCLLPSGNMPPASTPAA